MDNAMSQPGEIPLAAVTRVPVESLALDHRNPRLVGKTQFDTELEIIAQLFRSDDLSELLQSIAANGYLDIEPLIVLEAGGRLKVLEGNRRLAAIRLLREPELAARASKAGRIKIAVPDIPCEFRKTLDQVSVYRVESRERARSFIGYKHINGAAKWESYAKAKFAADWYRDGEVSLADIADRIGDKHDTVKRMVNAIYVLEQAQNENLFNPDNRISPRFNFSHLYTALSRAPYMRFLNLTSAWSSFDPNPDPVPSDSLEKLKELLKWLYGSKEDAALPVVKSQNPDIKHLGEILDSSEGLTVLRAKNSLFEAHASTQPADRKFVEALLRSRQEIREASNSLRGFDGRDTALIDIAEDISETAQAIHTRMKKKMRDTAVDS